MRNGAPIDEEDGIRAIRYAIEEGCNFFDTAECYIGKNEDGSTSYNEELVGKALAPYRENVKVATKFGVHHKGIELVMDAWKETIHHTHPRLQKACAY